MGADHHRVSRPLLSVRPLHLLLACPAQVPGNDDRDPPDPTCGEHQAQTRPPADPPSNLGDLHVR